jgi:hypothetical protein
VTTSLTASLTGPGTGSRRVQRDQEAITGNAARSCEGPIQGNRRRWAIPLVGLLLAAGMTGAMATPAQALPPPCPAVLKGGDGPILQFCRELAAKTAVANVRLRRHYRPAQIRKIRRVFTAEARRADVISEVSGRPRGALAWGASGYRRIVFFDLDGIKKYAGKALKVAKRVAGGALKLVPQARMINCGLLATLAGAGAAIKGDQVQDILIDAAIGCAGAFLPLRNPL